MDNIQNRPMRFSISLIAGIILTTAFLSGLSAQDWTSEDKETWKKAVKKVVTTPPCCGACSVLSMTEGRKAYKHLTGEEKSEEGAKIFRDHEKKLWEAFHYFNPSRYAYWFGKSSKEEGQK